MRNERIRVFWWSSAAMATCMIAASVWAQPPTVSPGPSQACDRGGPLHRLIHHSAHTVHDKLIGYPENFIEPPLGFYVREQFALQTAKADPHRFTLYKSDFLPGTNRFSPTGASRFNLMFTRVPGWLGPIIVEWSPDQPGLAESRRQAVLATFQRAGQPILPERVVIGPSPYPGAMGVESVNFYNNVWTRSAAAGASYPLTPANAAYQYGGGGAQ